MAEKGLTHPQRQARREALRADVAGGMPIAEAAALHGLTVGTAKEYCKGLIKEMLDAGRGRPAVSQLEILADLLNTDDQLIEIARRRGCSVQQVSEVNVGAAKAGLKMPERRSGPRPDVRRKDRRAPVEPASGEVPTESFGQRLTRLRWRAKLSIGQLAARSGVSERHLGKLGRGESAPGLEVAEKLARALGLGMEAWEGLKW